MNDISVQNPAIARDIRDLDFIGQLGKLRKIRDILVSEAVQIKDEDTGLLSFGSLNRLRWAPKGREPTAEEWEMVETRLDKLSLYINYQNRQKLQLSLAPKFLFWLPVILFIIAALSLAIAVFPPDYAFFSTIGADGNGWRLFAFVLWLVSLGAMGAIAFLYVNALSIQVDASVDVTNRSFVAMRTIIGALFGVVISLPVTYDGFAKFCNFINGAATEGVADSSNGSSFAISGLLLLLPFILGFSTSLVLNILNRFIESIQTFFGISPPTSGEPSNPKTSKP